MAFRHVIADDGGKLRSNLGKSIVTPSANIVVPSPSILRKGLGQSSPIETIQYVDSPKTSLIRKGLGNASEGDNFYQFGITELLLHAENNSDSSFYPKTVTNNSVTVSSAQSKFGTKSFLFGNNTSQYLSIGDNTLTSQFWHLGSIDFILECFFYLNGLTFPQQLMGVWGGTYAWRLTLNNGNQLVFAVYDTGGTTRVWASVSQTWFTGQWYHLAISRLGENCRSWIDGVLKSTVAVSGFSANRPTRSLEIGRNGDNTWPVNGYMDEIRFVRGYGVDTASVPTAPYLP